MLKFYFQTMEGLRFEAEINAVQIPKKGVKLSGSKMKLWGALV